jgi:hypothetical protein
MISNLNTMTRYIDLEFKLQIAFMLRSCKLLDFGIKMLFEA